MDGIFMNAQYVACPILCIRCCRQRQSVTAMLTWVCLRGLLVQAAVPTIGLVDCPHGVGRHCAQTAVSVIMESISI
jgi:hypothetical protein